MKNYRTFDSDYCILNVKFLHNSDLLVSFCFNHTSLFHKYWCSVLRMSSASKVCYFLLQIFKFGFRDATVCYGLYLGIRQSIPDTFLTF